MRQFYHLYVITRKRLGLPPLPYRFFRALWEVLGTSPYLKLLLAIHQEQAVSGMILFGFRNMLSAEFAADDGKSRKLYPNHFLYWKAITGGCKQGFRVFSFGRTSLHNHGLITFKKRWATKAADLTDYYFPKSFAEAKVEREASLKYKTVITASHTLPTFLFRILGAFCYRHMG